MDDDDGTPSPSRQCVRLSVRSSPTAPSPVKGSFILFCVDERSSSDSIVRAGVDHSVDVCAVLEKG